MRSFVWVVLAALASQGCELLSLSGLDDGARAGTDSDAAKLDAPSAGDADRAVEAGLFPIGAPVHDVHFYWTLDEGTGMTALDASGHGRTGRLDAGAKWTAEVAPVARPFNANAVYVDGTNSIAMQDDVTQFTAYTVALWVKPQSTNGAAAPTKMNILFRGTDPLTAADPRFQLRISENGHFEHYVNDGGSGTCATVGTCVTGTTTVPWGMWHHVAVTVESGGTMHLYVDGFEEGAGPPIGNIAQAGDRYALAAPTSNGFEGFAGILDDMIVYDWALTRADIGKLAAMR